MPRGKDLLCDHITQVEGNKVQCNFCQEIFVGGVARMRNHFSNMIGRDVRPCLSVPNEVREASLKIIQELESRNKKQKINDFLKQSGSSIECPTEEWNQDGSRSKVLVQKTINSVMKKSEKEEADKAIVRCIVNNNLPFQLLRSSDFREALAVVAKVGPGYEAPSSETTRTKLLDKLKLEAEDHIQCMKKEWDSTGCTIMSDGWTDGRNRLYLNLLAASPKGVVFLKSLCTVGHKKDVKYICDLISSVIEDIGPHNIIQFISDNASNYLAAGNLIVEKYPHIFKVNCAAHCINLMFKEFGTLEFVSPLLAQARKIVKFIYSYQHVLELMRVHTSGRELKRPGATRFATHFICLNLILEEEQSLRYMVASTEWRDLPPCKTVEGTEIQQTIMGKEFWECRKVLITTSEPLFKILRMVDGDGSTVGYIHYAIQKVKEAMKYVFDEYPNGYLPFWKIIDEKCVKSLNSDIHLTAFYLNPHLFHSGHVKMDNQVKKGLKVVLSKMLTHDERSKAIKELKEYHAKDPKIFGAMAIESLEVAHPRIWWNMWGGSLPILQKVAVKILSQTCSASACERNWSAFEATHTKKKNRLEPSRLQDLVYVRVNSLLKRTMQKKEQLDTVPIDLDKVDPDVTYIFYGDGNVPIHDDQHGNEDNNIYSGEEDTVDDNDDTIELEFLG